MSDLFRRIEDLSREEALEAAQYVALRVLQDQTPGEREESILKSLLDNPYANIQEIEQLSRLVLLTAAATPEDTESVISAIDGAGRKQVVLGGTEIIALATIGLLSLRLLLTRGKASERQTIKIEEKEGQTVVMIQNEISYEISTSLGQLLKKYFSE